MAEARVDPFGHFSAHVLHDGGGLMYPFDGGVEVDVAAAEEHWRALQVSAVVAFHALWPDHATGQHREAAVALRVARRVLTDQTGTLREAEKYGSLGGDAGSLNFSEYLADAFKCRVEPRLVVLERRQERVGVPGVVGRFGRHECDAIDGQHFSEAEDAAGAVAAAVDHDHRSLGILKGNSGAGLDSACVQSVHVHQPIHSGVDRGCRTRSMSARWGSSCSGSISLCPRVAGSSSTAKPGPAVAISTIIPCGLAL